MNSVKRGIYLVANKSSQEICENLIYSIRASGCVLPIRIIHFGGEEISSPYISSQVEFLDYNNYPENAKEFIRNLRTVLTDCPLGFLYRYLAWFSDWDEFIYSDNDIVALCNWENLFDYLENFDLIHADEEYTTKGIFNYYKPEAIQSIFGHSALESAITAGHIIVKRNNRMLQDISNAITWFKENSDIPHKHDQSMLHIASLLGNWRVLNLCKAPHNWLSSWAGDYKNTLQLIQSTQKGNARISHLHYSGGTPRGNLAIQELLYSIHYSDKRLSKLSLVWFRFFSKYEYLSTQYRRATKFLKRQLA